MTMICCLNNCHHQIGNRMMVKFVVANLNHVVLRELNEGAQGTGDVMMNHLRSVATL